MFSRRIDVYDFEGEHADGADQHGGPSRLLTFLELPRSIGEYVASRTLDLVSSPSDEGEGRPVLVLPGFAAPDAASGRLRDHLHRRGYRTHGWGQGRNIGLTDPLIDGLTRRFTELRDRYEQPVSVIGWSFGGMLARWIAHEHPDDTRQIICLASPWRSEGERTRATAMFERSRRRHGLSERAREIVDQAREPVPVPCTAVWSRSDGIVPWRGCEVDETGPPDGRRTSGRPYQPAIAENVEVASSHVGMVANPLVLAAVVDRLRQDPEDWRAFDWRTCLGHAFLPARLQRTTA